MIKEMTVGFCDESRRRKKTMSAAWKIKAGRHLMSGRGRLCAVAVVAPPLLPMWLVRRRGRLAALIRSSFARRLVG